MKRCIAYRAVPGCRSAWTRCTRRALSGLDFCRKHMGSIHEILLGVIVHGSTESDRRSGRTTSNATQTPPRSDRVN